MTILFWTGAVLLLLLSLTPYSPISTKFIDLPSHFVLQWAIGALILLVLGIYFRIHGKGIYITLLLAYFLCLAQMLPYLVIMRATPKDGTHFKILHANVWKRNKDSSAFKKLILKENPDFISIAEVTKSTMAMASEIKKEYPYQYTIAGNNKGHNIAILSKHKADGVEERPLTDKSSALSLSTRIKDKTINFVIIHAANPVSGFALRDAEFKKLSTWYDETQLENIVIVGDLNATPYSPALKRMTQHMKLNNARKGQGLGGTYPEQSQIPFLRIPIDHVLTSKTITVEEFHVGADIYSDHLPIIATLRL